jgi:hypothetical protein
MTAGGTVGEAAFSADGDVGIGFDGGSAGEDGEESDGAEKDGGGEHVVFRKDSWLIWRLEG